MVLKRNNVDIRAEIMRAGLKNHEVGQRLGMTETRFSHWLNSDLGADERERVLQAIRELQQEQGNAEEYSAKTDIFTTRAILEPIVQQINERAKELENILDSTEFDNDERKVQIEMLLGFLYEIGETIDREIDDADKLEKLVG